MCITIDFVTAISTLIKGNSSFRHPGHEHTLATWVTGASTAELAVILIDAARAVLTQTRRQQLLAQLLGIRHVVRAVNKDGSGPYMMPNSDPLL